MKLTSDCSATTRERFSEGVVLMAFSWLFQGKHIRSMYG